MGVTALDTLRLNVTNLSPDELAPPCRVQLGFLDAAGALLKTAGVSIPSGQTVSLQINYRDASAATASPAMPQRFNLRPLVSSPPDPCRITASAELVDSLTGLTMDSLLPAVQSNIAPAAAATVVGN